MNLKKALILITAALCIFLSSSCKDFFGASTGEVSTGDTISKSESSGPVTLETQIIQSGSLMIKEIADDLMVEGMSLAEVKEMATEVEDELKIAGSLAIGSSSSLNLAKSGYTTNPIALAAKIALRGGYRGAKKSRNAKLKSKNIPTKIGKSAARSLKKIKQDRNISANLEEIHFSGAITKIASESVKSLPDFGVTSNELSTSITELGNELVDTIKDSGVIESNTSQVAKVVSGLIAGSTEVEYSDVDSNSDLNPPVVAVEVAMEIYNENTDSDFSIESKGDFEIIKNMVFEAAADTMDDTIASAVDAYVEVAVTVYDAHPEEIQAGISVVTAIYEEEGVALPEDLAELADTTDVIEELVEEGSLTEAEASSYESAIAATVQVIKTEKSDFSAKKQKKHV